MSLKSDYSFMTTNILDMDISRKKGDDQRKNIMRVKLRDLN